ncbi:MAG: protein phosphatase 2C domain-containing protein [Lachnospiraceae bacterium]|nr:protein phosphatase 2C domain-containing protein [Lachnospiraceae bacterium]
MARYEVSYCLICDIGKIRKINQDNFIADGVYLKNHESSMGEPLRGESDAGKDLLLGVFDGMGGEECGEMASLIASECAARTVRADGTAPVDLLLDLCTRANERIYRYAADNNIESMGTTGAMLYFSKDGISLCNIGDSRIFRFVSGELKQISIDHVAPYKIGGKPPLSQNLGIPPEEMQIDPYVATGEYWDGDVYLICSDGLTDMVQEDEIARVLSAYSIWDAVPKLLREAIENGGKDNITIILCRVKKKRSGFFDLFGRQRR